MKTGEDKKPWIINHIFCIDLYDEDGLVYWNQFEFVSSYKNWCKNSNEQLIILSILIFMIRMVIGQVYWKADLLEPDLLKPLE